MKDIIIIGSGPGGYETAIRGAQLGAKVTLIEKAELGGTCLNRGCIPTKVYFRNAEIIENIKHSSDFGINVESYSLDEEKMKKRKNEIVDKLVSGIDYLLKAHKIEFIQGTARLVGNNTVEVVTNTDIISIEGKNIIIATGSSPSSIPVEGADLPGIYTSKELLDFEKIPESLAIIGAGVIGSEFANIFQSFGSKVHLFLRSKYILKHEDIDVSKRLASYFKKRNIKIHNEIKYKKIVKENNKFTIYFEKKNKEKSVTVEKLLISAGRKPNIENIGLDTLGIEYTRKGISVNKQFKTNIDNIFAIGDVNGIKMLAHAAAHQGIEVVERIMGHEVVINQDLVPNSTFVFPEVSSVGKTEEEVKSENLDYNTNKFMFAANGKALALGEGDGFIKVIEADNKIVGVHILGPHASDLIHEAAIIINSNMGVKDVARTIHAHPTLSETFVEAVLGLHNEAIHQMPKRK
ncbi:MAG: dihydrolipoyl dehydrogenase [Bacillota bacterium]|nr:dihydrolipoyl dehydrogenase [Bacillota bacterium]